MITVKKLLFFVLFILAVLVIVGTLLFKKIPKNIVSICPVAKPQVITVTVIITPVPTLTAKEKKELLLTPTQKVSSSSAK